MIHRLNRWPLNRSLLWVPLIGTLFGAGVVLHADDPGAILHLQAGRVDFELDPAYLYSLNVQAVARADSVENPADSTLRALILPHSTLQFSESRAPESKYTGRLETRGAITFVGPRDRLTIGNLTLEPDHGAWLVRSGLSDNALVLKTGSSIEESSVGEVRVVSELYPAGLLAEWLEQENAGAGPIGRLIIRAQTASRPLRALDSEAPSPTPALTSGTTAGGIGPDVIVGNLHEVANYGSSGGIAAFSVGTISCNIGDVWLNWFDDTNQHPVIGTGMFRLKNGRFEQLGMSWLKHGFFALSGTLCYSDCQPTNGEHLGVHCSDPYSASLNGAQSNLGPRYQVNASTGYFPFPPANIPYSGNIARRLQVAHTDLDPTRNVGALYFVEGQYVTPDDAAAGNQNNNASWRPISVTPSGGSYNISLTGTTRRQEPAIKAWKANDPLVVETSIQVPGDGLFILAAKATNLGNGFWHYEYAIQNLNSHRSARSFSIPIDPQATVQNVGFHDVSYHSGEPFSGNDWTWSSGNGAITWFTEDYNANQNANALRWGTLYNFRFDIDREPQTVNATLGLFRPGTPAEMNPSTVGPIPSVADCNNNSVPDPLDIANGTSDDCDQDGKPDECQVYGIQAVHVISGLSRPTYGASPPADLDRLFVSERAGRIRILRGGQLQPTPYLDISPLVDSTGDKGLQTFAFDPSYATNGFVYVFYTDLTGNAVVRRYSASANPDVVAPDSGLTFLTVPLDGSNHIGGQLQFGPDGFLYVGIGDSGGTSDPLNAAQDSGSLRGKLLRLDVHASPPYVPDTNPFEGPGLPLDEIWAMGLRNPSRFSFDRVSGDLYIADSGISVEELNVQPKQSPGGQNYGWRCTQGTLCTGLSGCTCGSPTLTGPALSYPHPPGGCGNIIGGFAYRGCLLPTLLGTYFYADSCTNQIHSFRISGGQITEHLDRTAALSVGGQPIQQVVSFGEDGAGELYIVTDAGSLYRISRAAFCGNNVLESGEQCDDGNNESGDGCDANCQYEVGPPNDDCINAQSISEGSFTFTTVDAATDGPDESLACGVSAAQNPLGSDVWFCYAPTCTGTATFSTCGAASFDSMIAVYDDCTCPNVPSASACVNDSCSTQTALSMPVTACRNYLVRVGGFNNAVGSGTITVTCSAEPPSVDCDGNLVDDAADIACGTHVDGNENGQPDICEATGDFLRGGRLYDNWWEELGVAEPTTDHPLWQYRPDQTTNPASGATTWKCVECHGWDYLGASGLLASGPGHTGFPGIRGTTLDATELFDLLKLPPSNSGGPGIPNGHDYGSVMSDLYVNDLVAFVLLGAIDTDTYLNRATGEFIGDPQEGALNYSVGGTGTHCANCHGDTGTAINFGTPQQPRYVGTTAVLEPWKFLHRVRVGNPGTPMRGWLFNGGNDQGAADIGRYAQLEFPTECLTADHCDDAVSCTQDACDPQGRCVHTPIEGACADDFLFCNGPEVCDLQFGCQSAGTPCGDPLQCDESANSCGCLTPIVLAAGNRYLVVAPQAKNQVVKLRLVVEPQCPGATPRYVGAPVGPNNIAVLVDDRTQAAELNLSQWGGTVLITGMDIVPETTYAVRADCGTVNSATLTDPAQIVTTVWGDISSRSGGPSADGIVHISDVASLVDGFRQVPGALPLYRLDLYGCTPNQRIDIADVAGGVDAFRGLTYQSSQCPGPCW